MCVLDKLMKLKNFVVKSDGTYSGNKKISIDTDLGNVTIQSRFENLERKK